MDKHLLQACSKLLLGELFAKIVSFSEGSSVWGAVDIHLNSTNESDSARKTLSQCVFVYACTWANKIICQKEEHKYKNNET